MDTSMFLLSHDPQSPALRKLYKDTYQCEPNVFTPRWLYALIDSGLIEKCEPHSGKDCWPVVCDIRGRVVEAYCSQTVTTDYLYDSKGKKVGYYAVTESGSVYSHMYSIYKRERY